MEIIIGLVVLVALGFFVFRTKKVEVVDAVPYKVETPAPVVEEAPAKKPRKPRAPKVEVAPAKVKAVKSVAKKAAPKKETAKKPAARTVKSKKV